MQLDLNLLRALDALLDEGSVAGAAGRLHLTAPAMSRTLGRIRRAMDDQVLVRTGRSMTPTPRALAVRDHVRALVRQADGVLAPERDLNLAALERTFTVQWHDAVTTAIGPALLGVTLEQAPGVRLKFLSEARTDTNDLRHGQVDLEIGSTRPELPEIHWEVVAHDRLVVAGHKLPDELDAEQYALRNHVTVSRRGRLEDQLDDVLRAQGLRRRVVAAAATTTAALHLARRCDVLVVVPELMCQPVLDELGLATVPLPFEVAPSPVVLAWHQRFDDDLAHLWLRDRAREALKALH